MKISNFFFIFIFIVFTSSFISAAQITQINLGDVGYEIAFPQYDYVGVSNSFNLHTQVTNITNGFLINNAVCYLELYSPDGSESTFINLTYIPLTLEYELPINENNFSTMGIHAFFIRCYNQTEKIGGFASGTFDVTANGKPFKQFPNEFFIIIVGFVLMFIGLIKERFRMFKHAGSIIIMIMGVLTLYPGYNYINWTTLIGKLLGFILIGLGFYFFIEDAFSRNEQEEYYSQDGP